MNPTRGFLATLAFLVICCMWWFVAAAGGVQWGTESAGWLAIFAFITGCAAFLAVLGIDP